MWAIFAVVVGILNAIYYICNQNSKLNSTLFMLYRGFITALFVVPALFFFPPNFQWQYFLIVIMQGFAISYFDLKYFQAFQKYGAETVCSIRPLIVLLTFMAWLIIKPYMIEYYMGMPLRSIFIILSIITIVYATIKYCYQPVGMKCLVDVFPILVISTINDIFNKILMHYTNDNLFAGSLWRVFIDGCVIGLVNIYIVRRHNIKLREVINPDNIKKGMVVLFLALSMIGYSLSFYYAENPAYTSAIVYASVIWVMLINKIMVKLGLKIKGYQRIAKKWIFTLLIASIILIVMTS